MSMLASFFCHFRLGRYAVAVVEAQEAVGLPLLLLDEAG